MKTYKKIWLRAKVPGINIEKAASIFKGELIKASFQVEDHASTDTDLCICFGGDGSLLAAIRELHAQKVQVPVLGIHSSKGMGFLYPLSFPEEHTQIPAFVHNLAEMLKNGQCEVQSRMGLSAKIKGEKDAYWALNDIVLGKGMLSRMVSLRVWVDGHPLFQRLRGDGIIVSSATGSTAYALSAGGPVVHPEVDALILTPICPHEISQRPLVLKSSVRLKIEVLEHKGPCFITADGQMGRELQTGESLEIVKSELSAQWLWPCSDKLPSKNYFEILQTKLGFGRP